MKKILLILLLCLPVAVNATTDYDKKYMAGAVPEVNGQVVFQQTFAVKGKNKQEIYEVMKAFIEKMIGEDIQMERTRITMDKPETGCITARFEEWLEFKKKILYWDRTRFNYMLIVECSDGKCHMEITQISYYYQEDMDGKNGVTYKAEEWITDAEALNKNKTKMYPISSKFRIKTIDRVNQIFENAREAFETKVKEENRATQLLSE